MQYFDYVLYGIICVFPLTLFAFYPLRYFTRIKMKSAFFLNLAFGVLDILVFSLTLRFFSSHYLPSVLLFSALNIAAYFLLYKIDPWRLLFNFLLLVNVGNFVITASQLLAFLLFPQTASLHFHWTNSLCVLIIEVVFVLPMFLYIKHYSDSMIRNSDYDYIWRLAWLIPLLLSVIGFALIYSDMITETSLLTVYAVKTVFCTLILLCLLLIYSFIAKLIRAQYNVFKLQNDLYHQSIQKIQLHRIETQIQQTRILRHDLKHHVHLMCSLADRQDHEKLSEYLHSYSDRIQGLSQLHYTENALVNALLVYYAELCSSEQIDFNAVLAISNTLSLAEDELTIVFGNLLENGYQACEEQDPSLPKRLHLQALIKDRRYLLLSIENSYTNTIKKDQKGNFLTTKKDGSGLGLSSVKEIVDKYGGYLQIETEDQTFRVSLSIPLPADQA